MRLGRFRPSVMSIVGGLIPSRSRLGNVEGILRSIHGHTVDAPAEEKQGNR